MAVFVRGSLYLGRLKQSLLAFGESIFGKMKGAGFGFALFAFGG